MLEQEIKKSETKTAELQQLDEKIKMVVGAIEEVMGIPFEAWGTSRKREYIICQQLYVRHAKDPKYRLTFADIARHLKKHTHSTILRLERTYRNDYKTSPEFRRIVNKVEELLRDKGIICTFAP